MASRQVNLLILQMTKHTEAATKRVATNVVRILADEPARGGTPRDTQFASASWIAEIGDEDATAGFANPKTREARLAAVASARARQNASLLRIALSYKLEMGPIRVTNPVPYIQPLNHGHSKQAAPFFIERALRRAVAESGRFQ